MNWDKPPKYEKFQMISLRRDDSRSGVILDEPIRTQSGWQYKVFFSAQDTRFVSENDLLTFEETLEENDPDFHFGDLRDLHRNLLLTKLKNPLASFLFGLYASRTKFEVYQFKPAIKFLNNPDQRLLIADEVGLGKTIEAGIIYLELQARTDMQRVLVICPPSLSYKWQDELSTRFDEKFHIYSAEQFLTFAKDYERVGGNAPLRAIMSLHSIRRKEIAERIAQSAIQFDLVIIDEAHHCRNPETMANSIASVLSDNSDAMLLLTATPLHLGNQDLFHLLRLLSPGDFDNLETFKQTIEPNRFVNQASRLLSSGRITEALRELQQVEKSFAQRRFVGNPYYHETVKLLRNNQLDRVSLVKAQRNLLELNTLANIFTRTRKREVLEYAPIRTPHTLKVEFNPAEKAFYQAVIDHVREEYSLRTGSRATGWVTSMRERQVASCISAARNYFDDLIDHRSIFTHEDQSLFEDENTWDNLDQVGHFKQSDSESNKLRQLVDYGRRVNQTDTKFDVFRKAIFQVLQEDPKSKILVFSFFRGTLEYLYRRLEESGLGIGKIHGDVPMDERKKIVESFRDSNRIQILLSSEVGSEGLDFQFCNTLINYDLPWNPMRLEQRIGRLDRFGQKHKRINIYNLVIENSIEERIFLRLYERIGIFQEAIGDLEAILGEEIRYLSNELFSQRLTPGQEKALAERAANNIVRRKQEMEAFEAQRMQFMGQDAIFASEVESTIQRGKFISNVELKALLESFVQENFPTTRWEANGDDPTFALIPRDDFCDYIRAFIFKAKRADQTAKDFLAKLAPGKLLPITFEAEIAYDRKLVEFITLRHPLAQAAIDYWQSNGPKGLPVYQVKVPTDEDITGSHYFFLFSILAKGVKDQSELTVVTMDTKTQKENQRLSENFLRYLQETDKSLPVNTHQGFDQPGFLDAKKRATEIAARKRDQKAHELQLSNEALINARLSALEQTFHIKSEQVKKYYHEATDQNIRRMRQGQLRNIEARYKNKVYEINRQKEVEVTFRLELGGIAHLEPVIKKPSLLVRPEIEENQGPLLVDNQAIQEKQTTQHHILSSDKPKKWWQKLLDVFKPK